MSHFNFAKTRRSEGEKTTHSLHRIKQTTYDCGGDDDYATAKTQIWYINGLEQSKRWNQK